MIGVMATSPKQSESTSRLRRSAGVPVEALRSALREPDHVPERLLLRATERSAASCVAWARAVLASGRDVADVARTEYWLTVHVARLNGAIAGTPFFIALVPAYLVFLEHEYRLFMKLAALVGRDPTDLSVAADYLVLRGVHRSHSEALAALEEVRDAPAAPPDDRRPIKYWYRSVISIMVFAGFLSAPDPDESKQRTVGTVLRSIGGLLFAGGLWVLTWVFPLSFMVLMSWTCERDARSLGESALEHFGLQGVEKLTRAEKRERVKSMTWKTRVFNLIRALFLLVTLAVPLSLVGGSIMNKRWSFGWNLPETTGALAGLALVIGITVISAWEQRRVR